MLQLNQLKRPAPTPLKPVLTMMGYEWACIQCVIKSRETATGESKCFNWITWSGRHPLRWTPALALMSHMSLTFISDGQISESRLLVLCRFNGNDSRLKHMYTMCYKSSFYTASTEASKADGARSDERLSWLVRALSKQGSSSSWAIGQRRMIVCLFCAVSMAMIGR